MVKSRLNDLAGLKLMVKSRLKNLIGLPRKSVEYRFGCMNAEVQGRTALTACIDAQAYLNLYYTGPRSAVGNVSGYRCVSDCRSRGREFDPGPVPYFRGD